MAAITCLPVHQLYEERETLAHNAHDSTEVELAEWA